MNTHTYFTVIKEFGQGGQSRNGHRCSISNVGLTPNDRRHGTIIFRGPYVDFDDTPGFFDIREEVITTTALELGMVHWEDAEAQLATIHDLQEQVSELEGDLQKRKLSLEAMILENAKLIDERRAAAEEVTRLDDVVRRLQDEIDAVALDEEQ